MKKFLIASTAVSILGVIAYLYMRKRNTSFGGTSSKNQYSTPPSSSDARILNQKIMLITPVKDDRSDIWVMIPNPSVFKERIGEKIKLWHPGYPSVLATIVGVWQSEEGFGSVRLDTPFVSNGTGDEDKRTGYIVYALT